MRGDAVTLRWLDAFCTTWKSQLDAAAAERPGCKAVLDSLAAVIRLIELSDPNRQEPDFLGWSDEDLDRELRGLLAGR